MHGMLSAGILIAVFSVIALASLVLAVRIFLAGARPRPGARL